MSHYRTQGHFFRVCRPSHRGRASRGGIRQFERHPQCLVQFVDGALREGPDEVGERRFGQAHELVAVNAAARWLRLRPRSRRFRVRHPVPGGRTSRRDTSSKAARRWRCSSPCWPIATSRRSVLLPDELPRGGRPQAPRWRRPGGAIVKRRAPNSIEKRERRASTPETGVGQFKPSLVGQIKASKWARPSCHFQDFRTLVGTKELAALPQAQELRRKSTIAKVA